MTARTAAFTSVTPGHDFARLAAEQDVELLVVDAPDGLLEDARLLALLDETPCDVAILVGARPPRAGPVLVPFSGSEHDWAAVELGAWLARGDGRAAAARGREHWQRGARRQPVARERVARRPAGARHRRGAGDRRALAAGARDGRALGGSRRRRPCRIAGERRAWVELALRSRSSPTSRRSWCAAGCDPAACRRDEDGTRFTWTIAG